MASFVWEIDLLKEYKGPRNRFTLDLLKRIDKFSQSIRLNLKSTKLSIETVKKLLHEEKIINTLVVVLSDANWYKDIYQTAASCIKEIENTSPILNNYKSKINYFECEFRWLLTDSINWKGDEELCLSIFGN